VEAILRRKGQEGRYGRTGASNRGEVGPTQSPGRGYVPKTHSLFLKSRELTLIQRATLSKSGPVVLKKSGQVATLRSRGKIRQAGRYILSTALPSAVSPTSREVGA